MAHKTKHQFDDSRGFALAVGILVDEATVAIENIHAHVATGESLTLAAYKATSETAVPRLLAMLCILAVFIPAFFMTGAGKALFVPLALAVGFSMIASFLLSSTFVPILSAWLLKDRAVVDKAAHEGGFAKFRKRYAGAASRALGFSWLIVAVYLVLTLAVIYFVGGRLGTEIFPKVDVGQFQLRLRAPSGTAVEVTEANAIRMLESIKEEVGAENVALTLGLIGVHAPSYPVNFIHLWNGGPEEGVMQVQLKRGFKLPIEKLKERLRAEVCHAISRCRSLFRTERYREPGHEFWRVNTSRNCRKRSEPGTQPRLRRKNP